MDFMYIGISWRHAYERPQILIYPNCAKLMKNAEALFLGS